MPAGYQTINLDSKAVLIYADAKRRLFARKAPPCLKIREAGAL